MRVLVAGATGAVGTRLVCQLVERGHEVIGTSRSSENADLLRALGAKPVVLDMLDPDATSQVVANAEPDAIVHEATALAGKTDFRHWDESFADTNRLRTDGTDSLLEAARKTGVTRVVAQSYAGWPYAREGGPVKSEDDPLDAQPLPEMRETLDAIEHLEGRVQDAGGVVLRYGGLYGAPDDAQVELVRRRRFPLVGDGGGVWSFVHLDDAAAATVLAVEQGEPGVYNVVDSDPAPVREWLPALAEAIHAKPPFRVPRWLARVFAGEVGVVLMTEIRGASNAKARRDLGWTLRHPSWREGFETAYGG
ncbi:MAG TPA: NAD(P)-dependent oxidoreductase [Gaiella sp.]|jgi:nucleoside-diphosphate-sugar epimerase|nr:NAD(P)-dependent oxidoreductase [Gaiella sp.]